MATVGIPRVLLARWYFTLVGLIVTAGLCAVTAATVPATYQAKAELLLLPPPDATDSGGNPYLAMSGLQPATDVLARALSDAATVNRLKRDGLTGTYEAVRELTTSGPVLSVTAEDDTAAATLNDLRRVIAVAGPTLAQLQTNVGVASRVQIRVHTITQDLAASVVRKSQIRALLAAAALGLACTVVGTALLHRLFLRRANRRTLAPVSVVARGQRGAPAEDRLSAEGRTSPDGSDNAGLAGEHRLDDAPVSRRTATRAKASPSRQAPARAKASP